MTPAGTTESLRVLLKYTQALAAALKARDESTRYHCERVVELALELGRDCALSSRELELLEFGASFHDVGKIGIPDHILRKQGPLNEEEWTLMQTHSEIGANILLETAFDCAPEVAAIVRHHHEHFDGGGYPDRLQGGGIPLLARILSVADSFDALSTPRAYHPGAEAAVILQIIEQEAGTKHDPDLVTRFCRLMQRKQKT